MGTAREGGGGWWDELMAWQQQQQQQLGLAEGQQCGMQRDRRMGWRETRASFVGGCFQCHLPQRTIQRCRYNVVGSFFERNSASEHGAGLAAGDGSTVVISQSAFTSNGEPSCGEPPLVRGCGWADSALAGVWLDRC